MKIYKVLEFGEIQTHMDVIHALLRFSTEAQIFHYWLLAQNTRAHSIQPVTIFDSHSRISFWIN